MKIELNGTLITGRVDGLEDVELTIRRADDLGRLSKSFSSELTFYDDGYQIIKTNLIDDPNGFNNQVDVSIWDECCNGDPIFVGVIKGDAIEWCEPGCFVTTNVIEKSDEINCIKSTLIADNWNGILSAPARPIGYCIEMRPEFIQYCVIFLAFCVQLIVFLLLLVVIPVLFIILSLFAGICYVIQGICSIVGCSPPNCSNNITNPVQTIQDLISATQDLSEILIGCGRFHPSHYLRTYIENVCGKCGLTFQSSILNNPTSPYYNTVLFAAQVRKGRPGSSMDFTLINENIPIATLYTLLEDYLKPVFNAEYRVVNGTLILERKDYFQTTSVWVDTEVLNNNGDLIDGQVCFNWIDKEQFAFGRFEYQPDAADFVGYEAKDRYNDIIDWNVPFNPAQSGEFVRSLPLSPARFRNDGIETDVYSYFETALGGIINLIFLSAFSLYYRALLLNNHTAFNYKFLISANTFQPANNNWVDSYYNNTYTGGPVIVNGGNVPDPERFNYPFWFKENNTKNLYTLFHYIDDPRLPNSQKFDFNFEFKFNCSQYYDFDFDKTVSTVKGGNVVNGIIKEITVNFKNRTIKVKGIV